jgi:aryl-alcohol dehydrogenase-like predicted oxidoreductase
MSIPTRPLGRNGPQVSAVGFGAMGLGGVYGQIDREEDKLALLDRAHQIGVRFWDTADAYMDSEDTIGKWFLRSGKRQDIFLATKFGFATGFEVRSDPGFVKEACERSLKRLGVESIDLYYCHRVDGKTPIEKTVEAMAELKRSLYTPTFLTFTIVVMY